MGRAFYSDSGRCEVWRLIPDVVRYRGLLFDLVWKDLRARYRNAMMGFLWAVLQPLLLTVILTFVFVYIFPVRFDGNSAYPSLLLCGLIPWQFLATGLLSGTNSLLDNQNLIKKVYFPRELIPIAAVLNGLVNLVIGFVLVAMVQIVLGGSVGLAVFWVPFIIAIQLALVCGLALIFSCLQVHFRDVMYLVEAALVFGFYASPVIYPLSPNVVARLAAHPIVHTLYMMNPMAGLITAYRQAILENRFPDPRFWMWPAAVSAAVLVLGAVAFRRASPTLADYV